MGANVDRRMKRWQEQRWILDAVIRTVGVEWDQPRMGYMSAPAGPAAAPIFRATAAKVKRVSDFDREFAATARRYEGIAKGYEDAGRLVAARETYFLASMLWSTARWPIFEASDWLIELEEHMNHCYAKFIEHAGRPVEIVKIPFEGKEMPAYLHLPRAPAAGETFPCVINIPGMDSSKENGVSLYGDALLERGMAVLTIDGPGQGECCTIGIHVTERNHMDAAQATYDWLAAHPAIDTARIGLKGTSFGTFWGTQWAASLGDKLKGAAITGVCHEPGANTIFNMASPSYKLRYMFMADYEDEDEFDTFADKLDLRPIAGDITCPYMILAGSADQLSPIEFTEELFDLVTAPKRLVIYEGANHSMSEGSSATLGEPRNTVIGDWLADRMADKPMTSERVWVDSTGRSHATGI